jgi:hypothetical protein
MIDVSAGGVDARAVMSHGFLLTGSAKTRPNDPRVSESEGSNLKNASGKCITLPDALEPLSNLSKLEREKGFEPSTLALAKFWLGLEIR